jgi:hypothetical protein
MSDEEDFARAAAAKNAQKMVRILDAAKPSQTDPFGLAEDQVVTLFQLWLIVGSWAQTSEYVNRHKDGMLYPRAPKPNPGGTKDLDLVRPAIKGVAETYGKDTDTNHLKGAFDLAHGRMINFMLAYQAALAKKSTAKVEELKKKLNKAADDVRQNYKKYWQ